MFTTLLVAGGVLVGLVDLLVLIVGLSVRPASRSSSVGWVADTGRPHPDAWSPAPTTAELTALR